MFSNNIHKILHRKGGLWTRFIGCAEQAVRSYTRELTYGRIPLDYARECSDRGFFLPMYVQRKILMVGGRQKDHLFRNRLNDPSPKSRPEKLKPKLHLGGSSPITRVLKYHSQLGKPGSYAVLPYRTGVVGARVDLVISWELKLASSRSGSLT